MSFSDRLNQRVPHHEMLMNLCRTHSAIFAEGIERYLAYLANEPQNNDAAALTFLHALNSKLMLHEQAAIGGLARANQIGQGAAAAQYARRAGKHAQLALIMAFAMKKVAIEDRTDLDDLNETADLIIDNITAQFDGYEPVARLQTALSMAQQRGWAIIPPEVRLPMINGANWCPDTAGLMEAANALAVPVVLMFNDYLPLPEDKGRRKHGILLVQDHAQAVFEDGYEKPKIPIVRYPNGVTHFEPTIYQFVEQLVENEFV